MQASTRGATKAIAAVDLGAESGRVMLARFDGERLHIEEVHRFANRPVMLHGHRFWNVLSLWDETLNGLRKARQFAGTVDSIGIDSWAVDYGLTDRPGYLLGHPFHYRDRRTDGVMEQVFASVPREMLYQRTGIQMLPINTIFQLSAHAQLQPDLLAQAHRLLLIPDLLHNWLCGSQISEYTNATTTQCWDAHTQLWASDLLDQLGIPPTLFAPVVQAGTALGPLLPSLQAELGNAQVIAPATHDTGSAIAAAPTTREDNWAYISSGTWSLLGIERRQPFITAEAMAANYTNEGGVFGTTRFLKNVMGLWLLQACQKVWLKQGVSRDQNDYDVLLAEANAAQPFQAIIDPDDPRFLAPDDMPTAINSYLVEHGQPSIQTPAAMTRCIMESLVLRYCREIENLQRLTGTPIEVIHIVGGGARNIYINQWLADASGLPVVAGPTEATAIGNALMQLVGLGELRTLADIRALASHSPTTTFLPNTEQHSRWREQHARFAALLSPSNM
jgi:rhamnulokinase